jgi:C_GCAxxG_C_C family probable redox protein
MTRSELAAQLFCQGYNCAQAVAVAFCDVTGFSQEQAAKMAAPFGGGFGRQREVCGAVSGMCMVYGILYGYEVPNADNQLDVYADVQAMCAQFREKAGSIVCRDILKNPPSDPAPTPRTAEYYAQRPCARMVLLATGILEEYIQNHPLADNK